MISQIKLIIFFVFPGPRTRESRASSARLFSESEDEAEEESILEVEPAPPEGYAPSSSGPPIGAAHATPTATGETHKFSTRVKILRKYFKIMPGCQF